MTLETVPWISGQTVIRLQLMHLWMVAISLSRKLRVTVFSFLLLSSVCVLSTLSVILPILIFVLPLLPSVPFFVMLHVMRYGSMRVPRIKMMLHHMFATFMTPSFQFVFRTERQTPAVLPPLLYKNELEALLQTSLLMALSSSLQSIIFVCCLQYSLSFHCAERCSSMRWFLFSKCCQWSVSLEISSLGLMCPGTSCWVPALLFDHYPDCFISRKLVPKLVPTKTQRWVLLTDIPVNIYYSVRPVLWIINKSSVMVLFEHFSSSRGDAVFWHVAVVGSSELISELVSVNDASLVKDL